MFSLHKGRLTIDFFPAYALDRNPVKYLCGYWEKHELPNLRPKNFFELNQHTRKLSCFMRRCPTLVHAVMARLYSSESNLRWPVNITVGKFWERHW